MSDDLQGAVTGHHVALTAGLAEVADLTELATVRAAAADELDSLLADLHTAIDELTQEANGVVASVEKSSDAAGEFDRECDGACDAVVIASDVAATSVNEHDTAVDTVVSTATDVFESAASAVQSAGEHHAGAWTTAEATLVEHVRQRLEALHNEAEQAFQDTGELLTAFGEHVGDPLTQAAEHHIATLRDAAETDAVTHLKGAWAQAEDTIRESLEHFDSTVRESAEELLRQGNSMVDDLGHHIGDEIGNQLAAAFRELIEGVLAGLANQVEALLVEMTAGEAVTSALGAFLPYIIAVYKALQAVNAVLDTLGL
jgi:hypothetical protein